MKMGRALLYARTVQHLRPAQVVGRVWKALRRDSLDLRPAPPVRSAAAMVAPARRRAVLLGPTRVAMLGSVGDLASAADWDDAARPMLWRYHAHYFDDLRAEGGATEREAWNLALIERWLTEVEPARSVGYDPYPTSLRIVNWVRFGLGTCRLTPRAVHSLAVQARAVRARLEVHLLGNHLLANAKALVFAGAFFEGDEAREWLAKGLALLQRELTEQVLADGGHFERSPMYHALVLEDLLDLLALARASEGAIPATAVAGWQAHAASMRRWLLAMTHPDGEIALFNDAAIGQAPAPAALEDYARRVGLPGVARIAGDVTHLAASGYVRIERGDLCLICDVGEIGPSYLPGHAHADTLAFEASVRGRRWIVDSGTSHYAPDAERLRQRATSAHNTVEVDDLSSSEVWSSFRVARRAHPHDLALDERGGVVLLACSHDGFQRARGRVTHRRLWRVTASSLGIEDRLSGSFRSARARLHLAPGLGASLAPATVALPDGGAASVEVHGAEAELAAATWHPEFGVSVPNTVLITRIQQPESRVRLVW